VTGEKFSSPPRKSGDKEGDFKRPTLASSSDCELKTDIVSAINMSHSGKQENGTTY